MISLNSCDGNEFSVVRSVTRAVYRLKQRLNPAFRVLPRTMDSACTLNYAQLETLGEGFYRFVDMNA